jgi:parallel beta-helix repeat protein
MNYRITSVFMVCLTMVAFLVVPVAAASGGGSSLPDLKVTKIEVLSPLQPGGQVSVRVTCENTGGSPSGSFPIEGWIFAQPDYAFSLKMGTIMASGLSPGGSASYTFTFTLPRNAPSGKYDTKVAADNSNYTDAGSVQEQNENNNEKWLTGITGAVTVKNTPTRVTTPVAATPSSGGMADLWVSGVSGPKTAPAGSTIEITAEVGNDGNVATPAADLLYGLVFSTNTKKAYVIGNSVTTQGFSAHASGTATRQVTLPDNVPPGDYYIGVWIDHDRKISDVNIDNNLASSNPGFITITAPVVLPEVTPTPTRVVQTPVKTATPVNVRTPAATPTPTVVRTVVPVSTPTPSIKVNPATGCYPLNGPMTITQSGTYCLERDFSGLVSVKVSDVTIRGNGHTISGSDSNTGILVGDLYDDSTKTHPFISGFTLEDVRLSGGRLSLTNVNDIQIERVTLSRPWVGVLIENANGVSIIESRIENGVGPEGRSEGIVLLDVFNVEIRKNEFISNTGDGVSISGVSGLDCTDNLFEGNLVGLTILNSPGSSAFDTFYVEKNQDVHVNGNTFRKNTLSSLNMMASPGSFIEHNVFEENGWGVKISGQDAYGMIIANNILKNNKGAAVIVDGGPCIIRDNTIDNNHTGEETSDGWGVTKNADGISLGGNGHTVTGNTITNNDVGIRIYWDAEDSTISNNKFVNRINFFAQGGVGPYGARIAENSWNVKKAAGTNIMDGPYIGGNFWGQPDGKGFSQVTQDADGDGFCDQPYQLNEKNADALPLVDFKNPPKITRGDISVTSVPAGAAITLDGESRGVTPATLSGIAEGAHIITLKKSGYVDFSGTIEARAGQTVQVDQKLTPVPPPTPTATKTPSPKPTSMVKPTVVVKTPTPAVQTPVATPTKQPTAVVIPTKTVKPTVTTLKPTSIVVLTKTPLPPTQVPQNPCSPPAGSTFEERMAAAVFTETNKARAANGLPSLCWDPKIATVSKGFASAMAAAQNMPGDHNLPGNLWNDRSKAINGFGFAITSIRENIATGVSGNVYTDCNGPLHKVADTPEGIAEFVVDMWMNHDTCHNDGHRKNILASVTHIGVGVVKGSNGKYYIAQDFGMK